MSECSHGPVSSMPGSVAPADPGETCHYQCADVWMRKATRRVQGETDSMGCEYLHMCEDCFGIYKREAIAQAAVERSGVCDWCKAPALDLRQHRDFNEGMAGPIYRVCGSCISKESKALAEELQGQDNGYDHDRYDDWIDHD